MEKAGFELIPEGISFSRLSPSLIDLNDAFFLKLVLQVSRLIELSYNKLLETLASQELIFPEEVFMYLSSVVDNLDRLKKIISDSGNVLSEEKFSIDLKETLRYDNLRVLRNKLQHMEKRTLAEILNSDKSLLGAVFYWEKIGELTCVPRIVPFSSGGAKFSIDSFPNSEEMRGEIDFIRFRFADDFCIDISSFVYSVKDFIYYLDGFIETKYLTDR